jgi:signal transduction histidine kinase
MKSTSRLLSASWWQGHHEALLTAAPLVIITINGYSSRRVGWQWELVLGALAWLPLVVRNRWPAVVLVVVAAVDTVSIGIAGHAHPPVAVVPASTMLALYTLSVRWQPRRAWGAAAVVGALQFGVAVTSQLTLGQDLLYFNWVVVATIAGELVQERRATLAAADQRAVAAERSKEAEAERRVVAERMRIAHELHDVLAHHIAVVNAQAGVAQYLLESDPAAASKALHGITTNSRAALEELRITLGLLRGDADTEAQEGRLMPAPTIEHLDRLFRTFIQEGMNLTVDLRGSPRDLSPATELTLVRIIQESLTNASKHAAGSAVLLELDWSRTSVRLSVTNEPKTRAGSLSNEGTGFGLIGMRERAAMVDGSLKVGPTPGGGYRVSVVLPTIDGSADGQMVGNTSENGEPRVEPIPP